MTDERVGHIEGNTCKKLPVPCFQRPPSIFNAILPIFVFNLSSFGTTFLKKSTGLSQLNPTAIAFMLKNSAYPYKI